MTYLGPVSATKPAQEEEKGEKEEQKREFELPEIEQALVIKERPLLKTDAEGKTVLDRDAAFAIVAALTLTLKDVFRFAERLTLASDHGALGEQTLEMLDCRSFEVR